MEQHIMNENSKPRWAITLRQSQEAWLGGGDSVQQVGSVQESLV